MKTTQAVKRMTLLAVALLVVLVGAASAVYAQTGGPYDLTWSTIDGGGHTFSTGGSYSLGGTAGQPDAGALSGGSYTLGGGFWGGGSAQAPGSGAVYLPIILKSD